jgi:Flp pilus assembly protein TadG
METCRNSRWSKLVARLQTLRADATGVALIEFAMVVPILVVLFVGGFQLMEATSVYRKVTTTARSLSDLSTQYISISDAELQAVLNASAQIMAPYEITNGTYRVSLIDVSSTGVSTVAWSKSKNGSALTPGQAYALPAALKMNGVDVVVCDVNYTYQPIAFFSLLGAIPFKDQIFMIPRGDNTVSMSM